jgi:hypothetical protein
MSLVPFEEAELIFYVSQNRFKIETQERRAAFEREAELQREKFEREEYEARWNAVEKFRQKVAVCAEVVLPITLSKLVDK